MRMTATLLSLEKVPDSGNNAADATEMTATKLSQLRPLLVWSKYLTYRVLQNIISYPDLGAFAEATAAS